MKCFNCEGNMVGLCDNGLCGYCNDKMKLDHYYRDYDDPDWWFTPYEPPEWLSFYK